MTGGTVAFIVDGRREDGAAHARPSRGRRRQVAARGFPRLHRHRPEPRRHAAARDRLGARHASSAEEAVAYAKALHALVRWIDICDGNMQEGSFRCDANVSVRPAGSDKLGTRCEIKNLNSFRFLEQAIEYEAARQIEMIEDGGRIVQETVLFDPDRDETRADAQQGRRARLPLFPRSRPAAARDVRRSGSRRSETALPELPGAKRERFDQRAVAHAVRRRVLTAEPRIGRLLRSGGRRPPRRHRWPQADCANWIAGALSARLNDAELEYRGEPGARRQLRRLVERIADGTLSGKIAREVFDAMWSGERGDDAPTRSSRRAA